MSSVPVTHDNPSLLGILAAAAWQNGRTRTNDVQSILCNSLRTHINPSHIVNRQPSSHPPLLCHLSIVNRGICGAEETKPGVVYEISSVCRSSCVGYPLLQGRLLRANSPRPFAPSSHRHLPPTPALRPRLRRTVVQLIQFVTTYCLTRWGMVE